MEVAEWSDTINKTTVEALKELSQVFGNLSCSSCMQKGRCKTKTKRNDAYICLSPCICNYMRLSVSLYLSAADKHKDKSSCVLFFLLSVSFAFAVALCPCPLCTIPFDEETTRQDKTKQKKARKARQDNTGQNPEYSPPAEL